MPPVEKSQNQANKGEKQKNPFVKGVFEYSFGLVFNKLLKTVLKVVKNTNIKQAIRRALNAVRGAGVEVIPRAQAVLIGKMTFGSHHRAVVAAQ